MFIIITIICLCYMGSNGNKYSESFNVPSPENSAFQDKPFRMQKLNLIWEKAQKRIPAQKLKSLHSDLKFQDKEELLWKRLKAEGGDKSGLKEAMIRGSLDAILNKYDLMDDFRILVESSTPSNPSTTTNRFDSSSIPYKAVFKDKKLNKLWLKAEKSGFTGEQLQTLKEEFIHHQNKIDQYYQLMDQVNKGTPPSEEAGNAIEHILYAEEGEKVSQKSVDNPYQILKEKHSLLKAGYDYLTGQVLSNMPDIEFEEPQVSNLWDMAKKANFSPIELQNLKNELHHFEHRIRKFKSLQEAVEIETVERPNYVDYDILKREKKLREYNNKVDKIHRELVSRILERHTEL